MQEVIDKESKTALSVQVSEKLIKEIRLGVFRPGKRLPGERMLADKFGTSRGTVIEALDLLEKQNYIERIPAKGTFISEDVNHELGTLRIILPFPEASLSPDAVGTMENWGAVSEVYRGMVAEAKKQQAEIAFQHFEDTDNAIQIRRQSRRMEDSEGAIFIGHQLAALREATIKAGKYCVLIGPFNDTDGVTNASTVSRGYEKAFDEIAMHLAVKKYRKLRILDIFTGERKPEENRQKLEKIAALTAAFSRHGIEFNPGWIYQADTADIKSFAKFIAKAGWDTQNRTEVIFSLYTEGVSLLYKYCQEENLSPGKNFGAFGYASGITFANLIPEFTYCKIDNFQIGQAACRMVIEAIRSGNRTPRHEIIPSKLIIQKST